MNGNKKIALIVSSVVLVMMGTMFVGLGGMLTRTTQDLGVALNESTPATVIAQGRVSSEEEAEIAAQKAYAVATTAFRNEGYDADALIAYEAGEAARAETDYAQPLGVSATVWAGRSQALAMVVAMEVIGMGALALVIGFVASRILRRASE